MNKNAVLRFPSSTNYLELKSNMYKNTLGFVESRDLKVIAF